MNDNIDGFLGEADVKRITSLSRTTRWRLERQGSFPRRRRISANRIAWLESEVLAWVAARANGVTEEAAA